MSKLARGLFATLLGVGSTALTLPAQQTATPAKAAPRAPARPAPPVLDPPVEGMQWVTGRAADHLHKVMVTISRSGVQLGHSDAFTPDVHDDKFRLGFFYALKAGDVVQVFVLQGSNPIVWSEPQVVEKPAAAVAPSEMSRQSAPRGRAAVTAPAPLPASEVLSAEAAQAAAEAQTAASAAMGARTAADARAAAERAIAAAERATLAERAAAEARAAEAHVAVDPTVRARQNPLVDPVLVAPVAIGPCDPTPNDTKHKITIPDPLREKAKEITGILPASGGTVSVCVDREPVSIANVKTPTNIGTSLKVGSTDLDVVLTNPLVINKNVLISWISDDQSLRVVEQIDVVAAKDTKLGPVHVSAIPKEGQTLILVETSGMPAGTTGKGACVLPATDSKTDKPPTPPTCLRVYVNAEPAQLEDDNGTVADAMVVQASGSQGLRLKTPLEAGVCVAVVAFQYGHPPIPSTGGLVPEDLMCDSNDRKRESTNNSRPTNVRVGKATKDFSVSTPLLASSYFDFGRVRGYLAGGSLFSYDGGNFSSPSIFMAFNVTKNWLWGGPYIKATYDPERQRTYLEHSYKHVMFETFFDARLTSLPVAACSNASTSAATSTTPTVSPGGGTTTTQNTSGASGGCPNSLSSFVSSRKAATLTGGVSIPFVVTTWKYLGYPYALTVGPIAKVGLDTPLSATLTTGVQATSSQFYTNFGFGNRFTLYRMNHSSSVAPENIMYIDVLAGRYSNFDVPPLDPAARYARPWRFAFEGIMKVPGSPFFLGFGANVHQNFGLGNSTTVDHAKDDLRFLFGAKFDAGKLFSSISTIH